MTGRTGKTRNIWLVWLVWPVITLGIYRLVWWYKINREARDFDPRIEVNPALSVLAVTIGALIIVPPFVSFYRTGERIAQMQEAAGMQRSCNGVIGIIGAFVFGLQSLYYQAELNRIWAHLGSQPEGTTVPLAGTPVPMGGQ
jgi:heme/copper-type cytochrome/quinol oxidase subunit 2